MKRYLPFALVVTGIFATLAVLFVLMRVDGWPQNIRAIEWRRVIGRPEPETDETAETVKEA